MHVQHWDKLLSSGHRIGPRNAAVTIVEFGDFECPFCAAYAQALDSVRRRYPRDFAVVFHHYPLQYHSLAYPLARASECAAAQGRFVAFHDTVYARYARHASMNAMPVLALGLLAGVPDTARFTQCARDTIPVQQIEADIQEAQAMSIRGTPAIIVDGMYDARRPSVKELEALITKTIASGSEEGADDRSAAKHDQH